MAIVIQIILAVTIAAYALLLTFLLKERASAIKNLFALYIASVTGWTVAIFLNTWLESALIAHCVFALAALFLTMQVWFARAFAQKSRHSGGYWIIAMGMMFAILSFLPGGVFSSISFGADGYAIVKNGFLSRAYSLFAVFYTAAPIVVFCRKWRRTTEPKLRIQLQYLSIGFSLFLLLTILTNSLLPVFFGIYFLNAAGPIFSLVLAVAIFYIIWQYEFLDIRRAAQRGVIYSLLLALIVALYAAMLGSVEAVFSVHAMIAAPVSAGATMLIGIFTIPLIERQFRRITDRIFFKDRYDYAFALQRLSEILHTSADFDDLIARIETSLAEILRAEYVQVILRDESSQMPPSADIAHDIRGGWKLYERIMIDSREIAGILVADKRSGDPYNDEDRQLLRTFSLQAATALARAQLFRQVQHYAVELEDKVAERTDELRRAQEGQKQLMLDIAHSLQTPLAIFQNKIERFKQDASGSSEVLGLEHSLSELSVFIYDLLALARLDQGDRSVRSVTDLSAIIADIAEEIGVVAMMRSITVKGSIAQGIMVDGNVQQLREACMNILGNALKYMREDGTKEICIDLSHDTAQKKAILMIRDTGIGIHPEELHHIFDRFYRSRRVPGGIGGTGLGLAITKSIIDTHRGTIRAESALGHGTTLWIILPVADAPDPRA